MAAAPLSNGTSSSSAATDSPANASVSTMTATLARMKTGQSFLLWQRDSNTFAVSSRRVLLFLREGPSYGRAGTLCWSVTHTLTEMPNQRLPLHLLVDMRCGKLSDVFLHDSLSTKVHDSRCFTLRTSSIELNLEAQSHADRELWWRGILKKLEQAGRPVANNAPQQTPSTATTTAANTPHSHNGPSISQPAPQHITSLSQSSGRLSPRSGSTNTSLNSLRAPDSVSSPFSPQPTAVAVAPSTSSAAPNQQVRECTPQELRALLSSGVVMRKYDLVKRDGTIVTSSSASNAAAMEGTTLRLSHIVLFAEGKGRSGSLYWIERDQSHPAPFSPVISREESAAPIPPFAPVGQCSNRIPLEQITDFMLRKKSPALRHASGHSDCCFALIYGNEGNSLNLEAANAQMCKMVKECIITMLTTAGKQVVKAPSNASSSSVATPVASSSSSVPATPTSVANSNVNTVSTTSSIAQPPKPTTTTAVLSIPNLDLLTRGARFMLYTCPQGENPQTSLPILAQEIYLWLQLPDVPLPVGTTLSIEKPGNICFIIRAPSCGNGSMVMEPQMMGKIISNQSFWLGSLKQMQLGKEYGTFKQIGREHLSLASLPNLWKSTACNGGDVNLLSPQCCLSIIFKSTQLHLEALGTDQTPIGTLDPRRIEIREPFIKALHTLMTIFTTEEKARRKALAASAGSQSSNAIMTPTSATSSSSSSGSQTPSTPAPYHPPPSTPSNSMISITAPTPTNSGGFSITSGPDAPVPHPILLRGVGMILYSQPVGTQIENQIDVQNVWVMLIEEVSSVHSSSTANGTPPSPVIKYSLIYTLTSSAPSAASLSSLPPSQKCSLNLIQKLVAGKQTPLFRLPNPLVQAAPIERCLSVVARGGTWNLQTGSMEDRDLFLKSLHFTVLKFRSNSTSPQPLAVGGNSPGFIPVASLPLATISQLPPLPPAAHVHPPPPAAAPAPAPAAPAVASSGLYAGLPVPDFEFLSLAHPCRLYSLRANIIGGSNEPTLQTEEGLLCFEPIPFTTESFLHSSSTGGLSPPGVLYFAPLSFAMGGIAAPRPPLAQSPDSRRIYLSKLTQLVGGKESTALQHHSLRRVAVDRCFTVFFSMSSSDVHTPGLPTSTSSLGDWSLECPSASLRECWIASIHAIMMRYGRDKTELKRAQNEIMAGIQNKSSSNAGGGVQTNPTPAATVSSSAPPTTTAATPAAVVKEDAASSVPSIQLLQPTPSPASAPVSSSSTIPESSPNSSSGSSSTTSNGMYLHPPAMMHGGGVLLGASPNHSPLKSPVRPPSTGGVEANPDSVSILEESSTPVSLDATRMIHPSPIGGGGDGYSPTPSPNPSPLRRHSDPNLLGCGEDSDRNVEMQEHEHSLEDDGELDPHEMVQISISHSAAVGVDVPLDGTTGEQDGHLGSRSDSSAGYDPSSTHSNSSSADPTIISQACAHIPDRDSMVRSSSESGEGDPSPPGTDSRPFAQPLETEGASRLLLQGQYFIQFTPLVTFTAAAGSSGTNSVGNGVNGVGIEYERHDIFLFFLPAIGGETPGSLYWIPVPPPALNSSYPEGWLNRPPIKAEERIPLRGNKFLLNQIRQMKSGKVTPALLSPGAQLFPNEHCLSLFSSAGGLGEGGVQLDLIAPSQMVRDEFMRSIHQIVVGNGMKAKVESVVDVSRGGGGSNHGIVAPVVVGGGVAGVTNGHGSQANGKVAQHSVASSSGGGSDAVLVKEQDKIPKQRGAPHSEMKSPSAPVASATMHELQNEPSHDSDPSTALVPSPGGGGPHHAHSHSVDSVQSLSLSSLGILQNGSLNQTINFQDPTSMFDLQTKIGEGSYGSVYRAVDHRDNAQVAIKIISFSGVDSSKLRNEIRVLRECSCPHIISYRGAFQKAESVWIVMEYCSGGSLSDMMLLCRHTFSENQISCIMRQTLRGLEYLHRTDQGKKKCIIHRDIKGGNILVSEEGVCKLADFGVSGTLDLSLGKHRTVIGTPHWMAPECLLSDQYNELVDIWSLGITAYELAVGQPPHAELHSLRAALKIPTADPPTLPNPQRYSPDLHSFLRACLVKDASRRPSATQLLEHPFIKKNQSTNAILAAMVQKTKRAIESKGSAGGGGARTDHEKTN